MKKIRLLPLFILPTIACGTIPLVSCGDAWIVDENYQPRTPQFVQDDKWFHKQDATEWYFQYVIKHPEVFEDDFIYAFINLAYKARKNEIIHTEMVDDVQGSFKVRITDLKIEEKEFDNVKHYLVSCYLQQEWCFKYHQDGGSQDINTIENFKLSVRYKDVDFAVEFVGESWAVLPDGNDAHIYHYGWEDWYDEYWSEQKILSDKKSGDIQSDKTVNYENHYHKNSDQYASPDLELWSSNYLSKMLPYFSIKVETENKPSDVPDPIIENANDVKLGVDYQTNVNLGTDANKWEFTDLYLDMNGQKKPLVKDKDWSFNDGVLNIQGKDTREKPLVNHNLIAHFKYNN